MQVSCKRYNGRRPNCVLPKGCGQFIITYGLAGQAICRLAVFDHKQMPNERCAAAAEGLARLACIKTVTRTAQSFQPRSKYDDKRQSSCLLAAAQPPMLASAPTAACELAAQPTQSEVAAGVRVPAPGTAARAGEAGTTPYCACGIRPAGCRWSSARPSSVTARHICQ